MIGSHIHPQVGFENKIYRDGDFNSRLDEILGKLLVGGKSHVYYYQYLLSMHVHAYISLKIMYPCHSSKYESSTK